MKKLKKIVLVFCVLLSFFLVFLIPFNAKTQAADSRFGINTFVLNRYNWQEWYRPIEVLNDLGASWTREEFVWSQIEPEKEKYNWDFYDAAFSDLSNSDINILAIIDYSAPWATGDPNRADADKYMPDIAEWRNYVGKVVDRYGHRVKYWQIWNEPNVPTFLKSSDNVGDYFILLKNASEVIRQKSPDYKIVLGGIGGVDAAYLRSLKELGAGNYFDILAVHPYPLDFKVAPEYNGLARALSLANQIASEYGGKEMWFTEFGWPTDTTEGVDEATQAKNLVRTYVLSFAYSNVKKLFWYDLRNDGNNLSFREHNFGLIRRDYSPKESFRAYKNLINQLSFSQFEKANNNGTDGNYDFSFIKGNSKVRVVWKINGEQTVTINEQNAKIFDILGNEKKEYAGSSLIARINDSPIFIISEQTFPIDYGGTYEYQLIYQSSYPATLSPNEVVNVWIEVKNTGTATWYRGGIGAPNTTRLGTGSAYGAANQQRDYNSEFYNSDWLSQNRPATMLYPEIRPGWHTRFQFNIKAPSAPGTYKAYFTPVVDGVAWMKDIGIYWDIKVN